MTTDPIAAARALIEPLTRHTPGPWCKHGNGKQIVSADTIIASCVWGAVKANTRLIAAAPDLRDMVATLADALEAARVTSQRATDGWSAAQDAKIAALERVEKVEAGRDALVAAAYVVAADACKACAPSPAGGPSSRTNSMRVIAFDCASSVRCLTPAHAQAALDKLLAEARLEGWRAGRDAAADEAQSCTHDPYVVRAIRALPEPKDISNE